VWPCDGGVAVHRRNLNGFPRDLGVRYASPIAQLASYCFPERARKAGMEAAP
jgi:hypothetical protein